MKNVLRLFMFAAILFIPAAVFAQGSGSTEAAPRPPQSNVGFPEDDSNFVVTRSTSGTIVGLKEGILTIKTDKDKEVQVALVKETKFKLGKKPLNSDELSEELFKEGKSVKITYKPLLDKKQRFDKVALEIKFDIDKDRKKPVIS